MRSCKEESQDSVSAIAVGQASNSHFDGKRKIETEMSDEVDASVIQKTQQTLGKYIQRPQLTDKLLKRPPFRFLHDIITTVSDRISAILLTATLFKRLMSHFIHVFVETGHKTVWSPRSCF